MAEFEDSTAAVTYFDLFSGIGAMALGVSRSGIRPLAFCEIDPFATRVLQKRFPGVPVHGDIRDVSASSYRDLLLVAGGFPCQPFSSASRGRVVAEDMWPQMWRVISESRPRYFIAENVKRSAMLKAEESARESGYRTVLRRVSAADAGADHKRDRWWLCAYPHDKGEFPGTLNAEVARLPTLCAGVWGAENYTRAIRVPDGSPDRMDRLRALGNAVIPQIAECIGRAILICEGLSPATVTINYPEAPCILQD